MVKQRQRDEEKNPDMDLRLRVMDRFRELLFEVNRDGITCPKGADDIEICIKFHSKGNYFRDCSCSHASLCGQTRADYIRFLEHRRSGYEGGIFTGTRKCSGEGRNFRYGWQGQHQRGRGVRGERQ